MSHTNPSFKITACCQNVFITINLENYFTRLPALAQRTEGLCIVKDNACGKNAFELKEYNHFAS